MHDWQDLLIRLLTSFEGVGGSLTAGLLLLGWFVLPKPERGWLRFPAAMLLLYVGFELATRKLGGAVLENKTTQLLSQLVLLVALARSGFLVVVDWLIGKRLGKPVPRIFRDILQGLLFIVIALVLFRSMGVELGSLLTTSAILTAVIGLSLQESLGNLVAGLAVRAEHPFEIGDWVDIGDSGRCLGRVVEINWRATKLRTNNLVDIVVPNGFIAKSTISNFSRPSAITRRIIDFQGPYDAAPDQVKAAVLAALRGCPGVAVTPAPRIWVWNFGANGVDYKAVYFLEDFSARDTVDSDVRIRIYYGLGRAKISFPFPVRDVRILQQTTTPTASPCDLTHTSRLDLLAKTQLFSAMPDAIVRQMADAMTPEMYAEGERIVVEGEPGTDLFVIARGDLKVITENAATGERCTLATLGPGQLFGELSLVTGIRGATVLASTQSVLLRLGLDEFRTLISQVPGLGEALLTQVVERQEQLGRPENLGLDPATPTGLLRSALFDKIRRFFSQPAR